MIFYLPGWPPDVLWNKLSHKGWRDCSQLWPWFCRQSVIQGDQCQPPRIFQAKQAFKKKYIITDLARNQQAAFFYICPECHYSGHLIRKLSSEITQICFCFRTCTCSYIYEHKLNLSFVDSLSLYFVLRQNWYNESFLVCSCCINVINLLSFFAIIIKLIHCHLCCYCKYLVSGYISSLLVREGGTPI